LPNAEQAVVPKAKITRYLLDLNSENGKAKARFFLAFGFKKEAWNVMADALKQHATGHEIARFEERPPFGTRYVIEGTLQTPLCA